MARVSFFYGVDPWRVIAELPMRIVRALARQTPRLQAERSIEATDELAVGINKAFMEDTTKAPIHRWLDAIQPGQSRPTRATPERLAEVGIKLIRAKKVSRAAG